jgi:hypothetical protein
MSSDKEMAAETSERRDNASRLVGAVWRRLRAIELRLGKLESLRFRDTGEEKVMRTKRQLLLDLLNEAGISPWS